MRYPRYCTISGVDYIYIYTAKRSDVDLLISMPLNGVRFYELDEMLRESLKKKVDHLDESQLENNTALVRKILQNGIKIYG